MNRIALIFFLLFSSVVIAETNYCNELNEEVKDVGFHRSYIAEVTGSGRAYFFTAPNSQCKNKKLFIVPTDTVGVFSEYAGYTQIIYSDYSAWVRSDRLRIIAKPDEPVTP